MQSFVFVIMPFLMMAAVAVGAIMWGGGRVIDGARARARLKSTQRSLKESNDLLKEIAGQASLDVSIRLGLGGDMLDRLAELTDTNDLKLGRDDARRAIR